jgi:hypothetical protein
MIDIEAIELAVANEIDAGLLLRVDDNPRRVDERLLRRPRVVVRMRALELLPLMVDLLTIAGGSSASSAYCRPLPQGTLWRRRGGRFPGRVSNYVTV